MSRLILIFCLCSAAAFGCFNLVDFADLAAGWQVTTDIDDLLYLAENWLGGCIEPNAIDANEPVMTYTLSPIDLDGQYCDQWLISSLPSNGTLFDIYDTKRQPLPTSSTASMGNNFTSIRKVPYIIKKGGSMVFYYTESETADSFGFKTQYTPAGLTSSEGAISVSKVAYDQDALCFDRTGTVTISDANAIEFDSSFSFCCWIRPQARFGSIIKKRAASGPGFEISIRAGYLTIEAENTSGEKARVIENPVTLNKWQFISVTAGHADPNNDTPGLPDPPYSNAEPVIVGSRYVGLIDKLTWFEAKDVLSLAFFEVEDRTIYGGFFAPTDYLIQFRCDESSGSTIYGGTMIDYLIGIDPNTALSGNLTNVSWTPDDRPRKDKYNMN